LLGIDNPCKQQTKNYNENFHHDTRFPFRSETPLWKRGARGDFFPPSRSSAME
jgi:hypothetical protein